MGKRLFAGSRAGLLAGAVLLGGGGRLAMRGLALLAGRPTSFGLGATAGILLIGALLGTLGGVACAFIPRSRSGPAPLRGLLFGTVFFLVLIPLQPPAIQEEIQSLHGHLAAASGSFWALFVVYGTVVSRSVAHLDRRSET
ncbi:MAG: hypothetical protein U0167_07705 [bacterium]